MGQEILAFEIENNKSYRYESPIFLKDVDIEKVLVSNKIPFGEENTIDTLLVTCMMVINLRHHKQCFLKQAHM